MTTLINIAPESFASVKWYDLRRWIPYSLSLFQQMGLIDDSLPPDELARKRRLRDGIRPPSDFPTDEAWSAYLLGNGGYKLTLGTRRGSLPLGVKPAVQCGYRDGRVAPDAEVRGARPNRPLS